MTYLHTHAGYLTLICVFDVPREENPRTSYI
nr:MAG TPA: hypothetical protein [Caudoviricetes sp.]